MAIIMYISALLHEQHYVYFSITSQTTLCIFQHCITDNIMYISALHHGQHYVYFSITSWPSLCIFQHYIKDNIMYISGSFLGIKCVEEPAEMMETTKTYTDEHDDIDPAEEALNFKQMMQNVGANNLFDE
jgi:hypothetical protein